MSRGLIFWVIMVVWAIFYLALFVAPGTVGGYGAQGSALLNFVLFLLLGWQVYGPPVRG